MTNQLGTLSSLNCVPRSPHRVCGSLTVLVYEQNCTQADLSSSVEIGYATVSESFSKRKRR